MLVELSVASLGHRALCCVRLLELRCVSSVGLTWFVSNEIYSLHEIKFLHLRKIFFEVCMSSVGNTRFVLSYNKDWGSQIYWVEKKIF